MQCGLKMLGTTHALGELAEQGAPAFEAAVPTLSQPLKAEMAEREMRSIPYNIKAARLPAYKDLAGFDFAASEVNGATARQLHRASSPTVRTKPCSSVGPAHGKTRVSIPVSGPRPRGRRVEHGYRDQTK